MLRLRLGSVAIMALIAAQGFPQSNTASHTIILRVTSVASVGLNDAGPVTLAASAPRGSQDAPAVGTDTSKRLWYTAVNPAGTPRKIQARLDGPIPAGTRLRLEAQAAGAGQGTPVAGGVTLAQEDQDLIVSIPTCSTGRTQTSGAALRYSFSVVDGTVLALDKTSVVTITFTMVDQ